MLRQLRIRRLGVIDDAVVDLAAGLNVVTGETGAGKTMIVTGLGLLLGQRADSTLVRAGAPAAMVEGVMELPSGHPALVAAVEAGADPADFDDGLLLARTVSAEGRSRAHVGGRAAPVSVLAELADLLVAVHGQADQGRLRHPDQHRVLLDEHGGRPVREARAAYQECHRRWSQAQSALSAADAARRAREAELATLEAGLAEIEAVNPGPAEDVALRAEDERLGNAETLMSAAAAARAALLGDDGGGSGEASASERLAAARSALAAASDHDPDLADLRRRVADAAYQVADIGADLASYLAGLEMDPRRLAWVQDRRAALTRLSRRYGDSADAVISWASRAATRWAALDREASQEGQLAELVVQLRAELGRRAGALTSARRAAAASLAEQLQRELRALAMGAATVVVAVEQSPAPDPRQGLAVPGTSPPCRFGPHGADDVEIRLAANSGAPARSVAKAASGGELSRVMLALEVTVGGRDAPTFVFDEIDAGVGGQAALDVGARLAALARHGQVLVVTHLAQVAAYADRHLVVRKSSDGHVTSSGVEVLDEPARLRELARMMGGAGESEAAVEHARDLLARARARRDGDAPAPAPPQALRGGRQAMT